MLTAHVTSSVGWLGAVVAYLTLDLVASFTQDPQIVRAAFLAMELIIWKAIVPMAFASVFTGVINSLGTHWGLFRHYWVLVKLLLTIVATAILMREAQVVTELSALASSNADPSQLPGTLVHSAGGLAVLFVTTALAMFKPRGMTRYGWRREHGQDTLPYPDGTAD